MNREILFRGKRDPKYGTGWCYGVPYTDHEGDCIMATSNSQRVVIEDTVGEYTGLTDRNGVKIFEGDIVHYRYEPGDGYWNSNQNSVIEWESTGFYMQGIMGTNKYALSSGWLESIPHNNGGFFEVIGNIYDNPELLKGEENEP